ncbi:hypothetical protein GCM10027051_16250 [Niabella terrae]
MEAKELIHKIEELEETLPADTSKRTTSLYHSFYIITLQFVKNYIGAETEFYRVLNDQNILRSSNETDKGILAIQVLRSIKDYLVLNLDIHKTEKYTTKVDIISDFLLQAIELASNKKFHPAAAGILMGASLEEFLKNLAEEKNINMSDIKPTIDPVAKKLYDAKVISKQDLKDITSWAGIRNEATHGNFEEVDDRERIQNAIEGVNLFMRKYKN